MTSGSTSCCSLDGIGSNIHVVGLADLTSLYNSSSSIVVGKTFSHFRRCVVQSTLGMAPLNVCFNILFLRIFTFSFYTHNVCTIYIRQKNTFGHWAPLH